MYIHNLHHHNVISTSSASCLGITLNMNVISFSMALSRTTTSSHINIIINNIINSYWHNSSITSSQTSTSPYINSWHHININNKSHSTYTYIYSSCLRFTLPRSSDHTSLTLRLLSNDRYVASYQSKTLFFLKTSMQQGQTYIPIVRFPDT